MILDLNEKGGQALASELGDAARFVRADVSDPGEVETAVNATTDAFEALHICMNCAGLGDPQRIIGKEVQADLAPFTHPILRNLTLTFTLPPPSACLIP